MFWDMIEKHVEAWEYEQSNLLMCWDMIENTLWLVESEQSNLPRKQTAMVQGQGLNKQSHFNNCLV